MIVNLDKTGKTKTLYECDMCGKVIETKNRTGIFAKTIEKREKQWDLCDICYNKLNQSIKKYKKSRTDV